MWPLILHNFQSTFPLHADSSACPAWPRVPGAPQQPGRGLSAPATPPQTLGGQAHAPLAPAGNGTGGSYVTLRLLYYCNTLKQLKLLVLWYPSLWKTLFILVFPISNGMEYTKVSKKFWDGLYFFMVVYHCVQCYVSFIYTSTESLGQTSATSSIDLWTLLPEGHCSS